MNSSIFPTGESVLTDLGEPFIHSFIDSVDGARDDFKEFLEWKPEWQASFTNRFTANFLHERISSRLIRAIDGMEGIHVKDREPVRELRSGTAYLIRVKRHSAADEIATYPTQGASTFWTNGIVTLEGLESISLALGYYWDADLRAVGDAVLSFRDGVDNPIWAVTLKRDSGAVSGFSWAPVAPSTPELDLSGISRKAEEEARS